MCSASPGFIRSIGGHLAGQCRLLESYSAVEAAQLIQMHRPRLAIIDLRQSGKQQFDRTWAMAQNSPDTQMIVVLYPGELDESSVPTEVAAQVVPVEVDRSDSELTAISQTALDVVSGQFSPREQTESADSKTAAEKNDTAQRPALEADVPGRADSSQDVPHSGQTTPRSPVAQSIAPSMSAVDSAKLPIEERYRTRTPELRQMLQRLEVAAHHDVTILLIGETGSGKTHLAKLIHEASQRVSHPFVTVACGALPGELIESELFGHVKGAFTSAHADKDGKFISAGQGTILLDEIDVLTPEQQVKLLRVIEKGDFEPVGSNQTLHVKARIIAASNLKLQPLVECGKFRPDLYYRLNTLSFHIPPLRKRLPDIEPLARYFVHLHASKHGIEVLEIDDAFIHALVGYPWPGNVREMENAIRSAVIYCSEGKLTVSALPPNIIEGAAGPANDPSVASFFSGQRGESLGNRIEFTEKDIIEQALLNNNFSRTKTAKQLGISRVTLYNKMKKYDMMPGS